MRACVPLTALGCAALFFLVDPDAEVGCTIANRPMTAEEHAQYRVNPAAVRRRRPGLTVEEDEERLRKLRTSRLIREAEGIQVFGGVQRDEARDQPCKFVRSEPWQDKIMFGVDR